MFPFLARRHSKVDDLGSFYLPFPFFLRQRFCGRFSFSPCGDLCRLSEPLIIYGKVSWNSTDFNSRDHDPLTHPRPPPWFHPSSRFGCFVFPRHMPALFMNVHPCIVQHVAGMITPPMKRNGRGRPDPLFTYRHPSSALSPPFFFSLMNNGSHKALDFLFFS